LKTVDKILQFISLSFFGGVALCVFTLCHSNCARGFKQSDFKLSDWLHDQPILPQYKYYPPAPRSDVQALILQLESSPDIKKKIYGYYLQHQDGGEDILARIYQYRESVTKTAESVPLDLELLEGLIAFESAGDEKADSSVHAWGLTQIYDVPQTCKVRAAHLLGISVEQLDYINNPAHNIMLGAVTLDEYTRQTKSNLLLGLMAYNAGPDYGKLPAANSYQDAETLVKDDGVRTYPLNVLAYTLMAKVKAKYGSVLPYDDTNKAAIEAIPLPGID